MTEQELRAFGRRLKAWAYSDEGYALLDSLQAGADSWVAGGCVPMALALHEVFPESEIAGVTSVVRWFGGSIVTRQVQHAGIMLDGLFVDGLGARTPRSEERWWAAELEKPRVELIDEDTARQILGVESEKRDAEINGAKDALIVVLKGLLADLEEM